MKILITGGGGQLARTVKELYHDFELVIFNKSQLDITSKRDTLKKISYVKPDIVFHFASLTRGDECAKDPNRAKLINVKGTLNVVMACKKNNCPILLVSTNEVFDGKKSKYNELSKPKPITVIGKTKFEAEQLIRRNVSKYYIVRTSWLYSDWSSNFIHAIIRKVNQNGRIELVTDEVSTPTYSRDLALALKKLIMTKQYGTYHIVNKGKASRYDFGKKVFSILGMKNVKIDQITLDRYNRLSKPPLNTPLESVKIEKLEITMPRWEDALRRYILRDSNIKNEK